MSRGDNLRGRRLLNAGRKKGTQNRLTVTLKEAVEQAFFELGGKDWLVNLAGEDPAAFASLLGKVLPKQTELSGPNQGPIVMRSNLHDPEPVETQDVVVDTIVN